MDCLLPAVSSAEELDFSFLNFFFGVVVGWDTTVTFKSGINFKKQNNLSVKRLKKIYTIIIKLPSVGQSSLVDFFFFFFDFLSGVGGSSSSIAVLLTAFVGFEEYTLEN